MTSHDDLLIATSATMREAERRADDTLLTRWQEYVTELENLAVQAKRMPFPRERFSVYDRADDRAWLLRQYVKTLRTLAEIQKSVFEKAADDAADHCGAEIEDYALITHAVDDFVAGMVKTAEHLEER